MTRDEQIESAWEDAAARGINATAPEADEFDMSTTDELEVILATSSDKYELRRAQDVLIARGDYKPGSSGGQNYMGADTPRIGSGTGR